MDNNYILAVDIGSSKICVAIAENQDNKPKILGYGLQKSQGIKKGAISNIESASQAIRSAVSKAKRMSGKEDYFKKAIVSISSVYTTSFKKSGFVNVNDGEITIQEISRAIESAAYHASTSIQDYSVIHILPYRFKLDDQDYIEDPYGMIGNRLEVFVHIIVAPKSAVENIKKAMRLAGLEVENIVLSSYASCIATLLPDEREIGAICIDMGGRTSEIAVYLDNSMQFNNYVPVGSQHVTNDIAEAINTSISASEKIKIDYVDLAYDKDNDDGEVTLEVPSIGDNTVHHASLKTIQDVTNQRIVETFGILTGYTKQSGLEDRVGTVVLTGGMAKTKNIKQIAEIFFVNHPVRIAKPIPLDGLTDDLQDETCSTIIGLILYGSGRHTNYEKDSQGNIRHKKLLNNTDYMGQNLEMFQDTDLRNLSNNSEKDEESAEKIDIISKGQISKQNSKSAHSGGVTGWFKNKIDRMIEKYF